MPRAQEGTGVTSGDEHGYLHSPSNTNSNTDSASDSNTNTASPPGDVTNMRRRG